MRGVSIARLLLWSLALSGLAQLPAVAQQAPDPEAAPSAEAVVESVPDVLEAVYTAGQAEGYVCQVDSGYKAKGRNPVCDASNLFNFICSTQPKPNAEQERIEKEYLEDKFHVGVFTKLEAKHPDLTKAFDSLVEARNAHRAAAKGTDPAATQKAEAEYLKAKDGFAAVFQPVVGSPEYRHAYNEALQKAEHDESFKLAADLLQDVKQRMRKVVSEKLKGGLDPNLRGRKGFKDKPAADQFFTGAKATMLDAIESVEIDNNKAHDACVGSQNNVFSIRKPDGKVKIVVCRETLFRRNPAELALLISKAVARAIDSCALDSMGAGANPRIPLDAFQEPLRACLGSRINDEKFQTVLTFPVTDRFAVDAAAGRPHCNKPLTMGEASQGKWKQRDQSGDAVAHYWANKAFASWLDDSAAPGKAGAASAPKSGRAARAARSDKVELLKQAYGPYCRQRYVPIGSLPRPDRLLNNVVAHDPDLRKALGCPRTRVSTRTSGAPSGPCDGALARGFAEYLPRLSTFKGSAMMPLLAPQTPLADVTVDLPDAGEQASEPAQNPEGAPAPAAPAEPPARPEPPLAQQPALPRVDAVKRAMDPIKDECHSANSPKLIKLSQLNAVCSEKGADRETLIDISSHVWGGEKVVQDSGFTFAIGCVSLCRCDTKECYFPRVAYRGQIDPKVTPQDTMEARAEDMEMARLGWPFGIIHMACFSRQPDPGEVCRRTNGAGASIVSQIDYVGERSGKVIQFPCTQECTCGVNPTCDSIVTVPPSATLGKALTQETLERALSGRSLAKDPILYATAAARVTPAARAPGAGDAGVGPGAEDSRRFAQVREVREAGKGAGETRVLSIATPEGQKEVQVTPAGPEQSAVVARLPEQYQVRKRARDTAEEDALLRCKDGLSKTLRGDKERKTGVSERGYYCGQNAVSFKGEEFRIPAGDSGLNFFYTFGCTLECDPKKCGESIDKCARVDFLKEETDVRFDDRDANIALDWALYKEKVANRICKEQADALVQDRAYLDMQCGESQGETKFLGDKVSLTRWPGELSGVKLPYGCEHSLDCKRRKFRDSVPVLFGYDDRIRQNLAARDAMDAKTEAAPSAEDFARLESKALKACPARVSSPNLSCSRDQIQSNASVPFQKLVKVSEGKTDFVFQCEYSCRCGGKTANCFFKNRVTR